MGSGIHLGGVIEAHRNMLRAMTHERAQLRREMMGTLPELGTPELLDRLKQEIEAMVDSQWANMHIGIARWCGGVSAEAEVRRILDSAQYAYTPLQFKNEAARELEMLKREVSLGMSRQPTKPGIVTGQRVGEDPTPDTEILRRLETLSPTVAGSYRQVLTDVQDVSRSAWKGTANELREVLREVLDTLAPDGEVRQTDWFGQARASASTQQERDRGPTHAEKVRFILERKAGIGSSEVTTAQEAVGEIESRLGQVVRAVYTRTSAAAHVQKDREEIRTVLRYARAVLLELAEE